MRKKSRVGLPFYDVLKLPGIITFRRIGAFYFQQVSDKCNRLLLIQGTVFILVFF